MDKKTLLKTISSKIFPSSKEERAKFNMTLGSFIKALKRQHKGLKVVLDKSDLTIAAAYGYPHYQGDLAFTTTNISITVIDLVEFCDEIMGRRIKGPKELAEITTSTPLWICNFKDKSGCAVIDVIKNNGEIQIVTTPRDY